MMWYPIKGVAIILVYVNTFGTVHTDGSNNDLDDSLVGLVELKPRLLSGDTDVNLGMHTERSLNKLGVRDLLTNGWMSIAEGSVGVQMN